MPLLHVPAAALIGPAAAFLLAACSPAVTLPGRLVFGLPGQPGHGSAVRPAGPAGPPGRASRCPAGDPLAGVYHPDRLELIAPCREARGTVAIERDEADGDHHIWIRLDPAFVPMARGADFYQGVPELVLEITPACPERPADAQEASQCPSSNLPVPAAGDHVDVWGAYVFDTVHGWAEIHPVSSISIG